MQNRTNSLSLAKIIPTFMNNKLYEIDSILVNGEIASTKFFCDLSKCKGACCTMESQYGAPVIREEINKIQEILDIVLEYLPERHRNEIEQKGFWEIKQEEELLKSVDNKDCVFVYYDGDVAKCAIEKAYFEGKVDFRKPISCHLFPVRISDFGGPVLRYERYGECEPALSLGKEKNTTILEFCKDSLERAFGKLWYEKLLKKVKES